MIKGRQGAHSINDMSLGEIAPEFYGRDEAPLYARGVQKASNMYPLLSGTMKAREGSELLHATSTPFCAVELPSKDYLLIRPTGFTIVSRYGDQLMTGSVKIETKAGQGAPEGAGETEGGEQELEEHFQIEERTMARTEPSGLTLSMLTGSTFYFNKKLHLGLNSGLYRLDGEKNAGHELIKIKVIAEPSDVAGDYSNSTAFFGRVLVAKENVLHFSGIKTGDTVDFTTGTTALKGFNIPFNFGQNESIAWVQTGYKFLYVGTTFGVYIITGNTRDLPPMPSSSSDTAELGYVIKKIDTHGRTGAGSNVAVSMGNSLFFASDYALFRVQSLSTDVEIAENVSPLAKHMFDSKIVSMRLDARVDGRMFILLENGKLILMGVGEGDQGVGFVRHELPNPTDSYFYIADGSIAVSRRFGDDLGSPLYCLERFIYWDFREMQGNNFQYFNIFGSHGIKNCVYLDCAEFPLERPAESWDYWGDPPYLRYDAEKSVVQLRFNFRESSNNFGVETSNQLRRWQYRLYWRGIFTIGWKSDEGETFVFIAVGGVSTGFNTLYAEFGLLVLEGDAPTKTVSAENMEILKFCNRSRLPAGAKALMIEDFKKPTDITVGSSRVVQTEFTPAQSLYTGFPYYAKLSLLPFGGAGRLLDGQYNFAKINLFRSCSFSISVQDQPNENRRVVQLKNFFTGVADCSIITKDPELYLDHILIEAELGKPLMILNILLKRNEGAL